MADPELDRRGHTAMDMEIRVTDGAVYKRELDIAPGFPGNPLSEEDYLRRFRDCIDFGAEWFSGVRAEKVLAFIKDIELTSDVRGLIHLLTEKDIDVKASDG